MKKLLTIFFFLFFYAAGAQSLHVDSTRFITGLKCCTGISYAMPTADKGMLLVGGESNNPGGIIPPFPIDTSTAGNVMIVKIDSNQKISWLKIYGGSEDEGAGSACQLPDGGYAVLASTQSSNGNVTGFHGGYDYWLLRLDASGNLLWENCYGGPGDEGASSLALTPDGGFIMLGTTNYAGGEVTLHYGNEFDYDWWVVKTDSIGNLQWQETLGGTGQENNLGTILSIDSAYYLISTSNSTDHNCTDTFWHPGVNTNNDYYVLKLDPGGDILWDSSYGGSNDEDEYYAMFDTRDSTIVINGGTHSDDYMVTGYVGSGDMWVLKLNKNGKLLWEKTLGYSTADNGANGICTAPDGGYMAYGGTSAGSIGPANAWIVNIDSNGNEIMDKVFGGTGSEMPTSIIPYLNGYVATGSSSAAVFTEGSCNVNYSGAYVSYIGYWPLAANNLEGPTERVMTLCPNPTDDNVSILLTNNVTSGFITIQNITGQVICTAKVDNHTDNINVATENWIKGIYLVRWQSEDGKVITGKLIID